MRLVHKRMFPACSPTNTRTLPTPAVSLQKIDLDPGAQLKRTNLGISYQISGDTAEIFAHWTHQVGELGHQWITDDCSILNHSHFTLELQYNPNPIKVRRDVDFPLKRANRIRPYWGYLSRMSHTRS